MATWRPRMRRGAAVAPPSSPQAGRPPFYPPVRRIAHAQHMVPPPPCLSHAPAPLGPASASSASHVARGPGGALAPHWSEGARVPARRVLIGERAGAAGGDWLLLAGAGPAVGRAGGHGGRRGAPAAAAAAGGGRGRGRAVPRAHHRPLLLHHVGRRHRLRERVRGGDLPGLQERRPERGSVRGCQWEAVPGDPGAGRGQVPGVLEPGAPPGPLGHLRGEVLRRGVLQRPAQGPAEQRGRLADPAALHRQRRPQGGLERALGVHGGGGGCHRARGLLPGLQHQEQHPGLKNPKNTPKNNPKPVVFYSTNNTSQNNPKNKLITPINPIKKQKTPQISSVLQQKQLIPKIYLSPPKNPKKTPKNTPKLLLSYSKKTHPKTTPKTHPPPKNPNKKPKTPLNAFCPIQKNKKSPKLSYPPKKTLKNPPKKSPNCSCPTAK